MTTRQDVQTALDAFKAAVGDFAEKRVNEDYDPRIHDVEVNGTIIKNANSLKTLVNGEESQVGHILQAIDREIQPLIDEMKGETTPPVVTPEVESVSA